MTILKKKSARMVFTGTSAVAAVALLAGGVAPALAATGGAVVPGAAGHVTATKSSGTWSVQDLAATALESDMTCASTDEMAGALVFITEPGTETPAVANATTEARSVYSFTLDPVNQMSLSADGTLEDSSTLDGGFVDSAKKPVANMGATLAANHTYSIGYACTMLSADFATSTIIPASGKAVAAWAKLTTDANKNWTIGVADAKFTQVAAPKLAGTAVVGGTLKASTAVPTPAPTSTSYQWLRDGQMISGAKSDSYKLTVADQGKKISARVTFGKSGYSSASADSATVVPVGTFAKVIAPKTTGTAATGYTLSATVTQPSPSASAVRYQWLRDGKAISGATKSSYKLTAADQGKKVAVRAEFVRSGYQTTTATSAVRTVLGVFAGVKAPSITGTLMVGKKVGVSVKSPTPTPTATYQWLRDGKVISGATKSSYVLAAKDKGRKITVKVTFSRSGYLAVAAVSASQIAK